MDENNVVGLPVEVKEELEMAQVQPDMAEVEQEPTPPPQAHIGIVVDHAGKWHLFNHLGPEELHIPSVHGLLKTVTEELHTHLLTEAVLQKMKSRF